ncbi:mCG1049296, partial [Mus musculus]
PSCCFLICELLFPNCLLMWLLKSLCTHPRHRFFCQALTGGSSIDGICIWYLLYFNQKFIRYFTMPSLAIYFLISLPSLQWF